MPGNAIILTLTDGLSASLLSMNRAARSQRLRAVMGEAVAAAMVAHFEQLDTERHENFTGVHFYGGAARSVQVPQVAGDDVTVAVNQEGVAQRYYGGTITAGSNGSGKKWITIPAIPAALGRRAGDFTNLKFVFFKGKGGSDDLAALVSEDPNKAKYKTGPNAKKERGARLVPREDGKLPVVFWLKRSVTQKADPSVIPDEETLAATAYAHGVEYLDDAFNIDGGTPS